MNVEQTFLSSDSRAPGTGIETAREQGSYSTVHVSVFPANTQIAEAEGLLFRYIADRQPSVLEESKVHLLHYTVRAHVFCIPGAEGRPSGIAGKAAFRYYARRARFISSTPRKGLRKRRNTA